MLLRTAAPLGSVRALSLRAAQQPSKPQKKSLSLKYSDVSFMLGLHGQDRAKVRLRQRNLRRLSDSLLCRAYVVEFILLQQDEVTTLLSQTCNTTDSFQTCRGNASRTPALATMAKRSFSKKHGGVREGMGWTAALFRQIPLR